MAKQLSPLSAATRRPQSNHARQRSATGKEDPSSQQLNRVKFPSQLFRVEEPAQILNIRPKTMRNRISLGQIDIYRVGRGIRISKETLEEIIARGYVPARAVRP
jgi:excisionase family DNA binding protein